MSATEEFTASATPDAPREASRRTRIDAPHEICASPLPASHTPPDSSANALAAEETLFDPVLAGHALLEVIEEPAPAMLAAVAGESVEARREQLQLQVSQLAEHLRERLKEADRREAQLNARFAQLEAELRAARVSTREREVEFQEREAELRRQVEELTERDLQRTSAQDLSRGLELRSEELDHREQELGRREHDLADREVRVCDQECKNSERTRQLAQEAAVFNQNESALSFQIGDHADRQRQLEQQSAELAARGAQLAEQERALAALRSQLERDVAALVNAQQLWDEQRLCDELKRLQQRESLSEEQEVLAGDRAEIARLEESLVRQRDELARHHQELTQAFREQIQEREQQLQDGEALLVEHAGQLDQLRAALVTQRRQWEEERVQRLKTLEQREEAALTEHAERRQKLDARQDWIEQQRTSLEQVRREILSLHRQSLEMRLIAEQLWSQITGRLTPAEVTHAIAQLRLKLAEQYQLEEQDLDARKTALIQLSERISAQHRELTQLRTGLREWAAARQSEIEQQAQALVEREIAQGQQQEQFHEMQHQWQADRHRLERQIRHLSRQAAPLPAAA